MKLIFFNSDPEYTDPMPLYSELTKDVNFAIVPIIGGKVPNYGDDDNTDDDAGEGTSSEKRVCIVILSSFGPKYHNVHRLHG